jgi:RNA polymerase sigma-70 factor (ECF subfamily)
MQENLEQVYKIHYPLMYSLVAKIVPIHEDREEIIHDVFLKVWNHEVDITCSMKAYLCKAVVNQSLNFVKRTQNIQNHHKQILATTEEAYFQKTMEDSEKIMIVQKEIEKLSPQCKEVFRLSRYEELSQQEIATKLNISIKTVKNHIGKALKTLHENISKHSFFSEMILILFFINFFNGTRTF